MIDEALFEKIRAYREQNPRAGRRGIAHHFNISVSAARSALRRLGVKDCAKKVPVAGEADLATDIANARSAGKFAEAERAIRRYRELLARVAAEREIIEEFQVTAEGALRDRTLVIPPVAAPPPSGKPGRAEEAVLVISDPHIGKLVSPTHTCGFGDYSPRIFLERLHFVEQTVTRLMRENIANPISRLHILFLGDLVEGQLHHAQEIPNRWLVADQVALASLAFYQFIRKLAAVVPAITCRGVGGNHARWTNQKKPPTENRYSNLDFIVMGQIKALMDLAGPKHTEFLLDEAAFQVFDILGWRFKIAHGDHLRGGDKAIGTPAHAIGREINATVQRYNAIGQKAPDYYLVGDKHRFNGTATATGRYLINGAWFSDDEYALTSNFSPCQPFQFFFGVHPKHGRSWSYELNLDAAPSLDSLPFELPERLAAKL